MVVSDISNSVYLEGKKKIESLGTLGMWLMGHRYGVTHCLLTNLQ